MVSVSTDLDDLAATHARISSVIFLLGDKKRSKMHEDLSLKYRARHVSDQAEQLAGLQAALTLHGPDKRVR